MGWYSPPSKQKGGRCSIFRAEGGGPKDPGRKRNFTFFLKPMPLSSTLSPESRDQRAARNTRNALHAWSAVTKYYVNSTADSVARDMSSKLMKLQKEAPPSKPFADADTKLCLKHAFTLLQMADMNPSLVTAIKKFGDEHC